MRFVTVLALTLALVVCAVAIALATSAFLIGRPGAALVAIAAGAVALWLCLKGESALDAQSLDEFKG